MHLGKSLLYDYSKIYRSVVDYDYGHIGKVFANSFLIFIDRYTMSADGRYQFSAWEHSANLIFLQASFV